MCRLLAVALSVLAVLVLNGVAMAHDDPIVTVRILCNGFNVLDMDAVLGEISDTATLSVDRPIRGANEIEAWVREQMDHDLRIEIVEMGTPQRLADGYTLAWTARFSREDWRRAGIPAREMTNAVTIHNGRITDWSASLGPQTPEAPPPQQLAPAAPTAVGGPPEVFGVPLTLVVAIAVVALAGGWVTRRLVRGG